MFKSKIETFMNATCLLLHKHINNVHEEHSSWRKLCPSATIALCVTNHLTSINVIWGTQTVYKPDMLLSDYVADALKYLNHIIGITFFVRLAVCVALLSGSRVTLLCKCPGLFQWTLFLPVRYFTACLSVWPCSMTSMSSIQCLHPRTQLLSISLLIADLSTYCD